MPKHQKRQITEKDLFVGRLSQELQQTEQPSRAKEIKRLIRLSKEEEAE